jgi:hypothetical protein
VILAPEQHFHRLTTASTATAGRWVAALSGDGGFIIFINEMIVGDLILPQKCL